MTEEAQAAFEQGDYHALDSLNAELGLASMAMEPSYFDYFSWLTLEFNQPYDAEYLATRYRNAEGVWTARPTGLFLMGGLRTDAQILHNVGYSEPETLAGMMQLRRNMFDLIQPDLVVCDRSPAALLASRQSPLRRAGYRLLHSAERLSATGHAQLARPGRSATATR